MGLKDVFKNKASGHRCEVDSEGVTHCQIFEADKEGKMSTGTDFSFAVNKETGCEAMMVGGHDILEKDQSKVDTIIALRTKACRKGL